MKNQFTYTLIFSVIFINFISCNSGKPNQKFTNNFVEFEYPALWHISDDDTDDEYTFLTLESKDYTESALFTISCFNSEGMNPTLVMELMTENLTPNANEVFAKVDISDAKKIILKENDALLSEYTIRLGNETANGQIITFENKSKVVALMQQCDDGDNFTKEFELIKNSLIVK